MLLGALYKSPALFEDPLMLMVSQTDFVDPMQKLIYSAMENLHTLGHSKFNESIIGSYLNGKTSIFSFYNDNNGDKFLESLESTGEPSVFTPSLNKLKKYSLLRNLDRNGISVKEYYDWDTKDEKTIQYQNEWLEKTDLVDIANDISTKIQIMMDEAAGSTTQESIQAGEGLEDLISSFAETPEFGSPMAIQMMNSMVRGARKGKFYLRSAPTGGGKSRLMMADTVFSACDKYYDTKKQEWIENGIKEPAMFITTELDMGECQTMALAFLTGIDEDKILNYDYTPRELEIVQEGVRIINDSPLYFDSIPDFSSNDIEAIIRKRYRENDVEYVAFDYIHTSMKFISEISMATNGMKLREDQILFMLATKLKDLANKLGIFIQSATQLNGSWMEEEELNQNALRGSKAIADRVDVGMIATKIRPLDEGIVQALVSAGYPEPNYFVNFYKIRRGKYAGCRLWCNADLSTCRVEGIVVTTASGDPIAFDSTTIRVIKKAEKVVERDTKSIKGGKSAF